jgi:hypothetical protein
MTDYEKDNQELISKCINIIEAETKPIKRKPSKNAITTMAIDRKRDALNLEREINFDSNLENYAKTL